VHGKKKILVKNQGNLGFLKKIGGSVHNFCFGCWTGENLML
jgi:hypothetical protein